MGSRILVVEDNAANLDLMVYLLEAFGHNTLVARDGEEGLRMAGEAGPDLIICDVQLPKMNGYEVVRRLKEDPTCRSIPAVAVTAFAMVGDRDRVLKAGFDGYLSKPIDPESFVRQIENFLRGAPGVLPAARVFSRTPEPTEPSERTARILVVDNVQANLDLARSILEPHGYEVVTASSPPEALRRALETTPQLILSDICMSEGSGYDFIGTVRADPRLSGIPFVFITSSMLEEEDRERGLSLGAALFLARPMEPDQFLAAIESCLQKGTTCGKNISR